MVLLVRSYRCVISVVVKKNADARYPNSDAGAVENSSTPCQDLRHVYVKDSGCVFSVDKSYS